ncbi:terpenoid cyclases/Protein prenyltransferase [Pholiota conissans]|uniref:Terpenoid cyclases/Protein prenyltransferase n=1 Tax=Pholiota conissans TaxID=109636 RepID=A0A9P5ZA45_9AGAR|nr:terpenoid cyclases/Protein prenyltransferase [Pholiota conissans]
MTSDASAQLPRLARTAHAAHCKRCLSGLPASQIDVDASRLALAFYCIGSLDLLGLLNEQISAQDRDSWRAWIWQQQTHGKYGSGFRPSPFMTGKHLSEPSQMDVEYSDYDTPHIIMTYTALLSLAILRDDFTKLDRPGLLTFLRACQREDGSFSTVPGSNESDLRTLYCAFAISSMLDDWSGANVPRAVSFIETCRTYEGGYGQSPFCEAQGGTTYIAVASLKLASNALNVPEYLTSSQRQETVEWLLRNQDKSGGFCGRTGKGADACYCFWCGAALKILGAGSFIDSNSLAAFIGRCQFKYGGISKAPEESSDPYHTYLSLAALSMYPPSIPETDENAVSWVFTPLDPLLNAREETTTWIRKYVPGTIPQAQ